MMQRDLSLGDVPIVRNCPDRWDPPDPRPDRIRQALGIDADTHIVLYQGGLLVERGIEQSMDAILDVPGAVLVLMGFGNQEARFRQMAARPMYAGKVHVLDAVSPSELLWWSASSDVMVMLYQPHTENHQYVTPQKLWEAMAAGVPVVASDLPGLASIVGTRRVRHAMRPDLARGRCGCTADDTCPGPQGPACHGRAGTCCGTRSIQLGGAVPGAGRNVHATTGCDPMSAPTTDAVVVPQTRSRPAARIGIISHGTSQFDSRAQRIARSCVAAGDTVTIYSRYLRGLPREEYLDGYRIVRLPLSAADQRAAQAEAAKAQATQAEAAQAGSAQAGPDVAGRTGGTLKRGTPAKAPALSRDPRSRIVRATRATSRRAVKRARWVIRVGRERADALLDRVPAIRRFRLFPWEPMQRAKWFERQVEPQDIWHGMWAGSLPALSRVQRRHGGATLYDARDVFLRSRSRATIPGWERRILTWFERRWAHAAGAVIQVSEPYAAMMERDLDLPDMPIVRNCPDRWDPPEPRPDRFRQLLGIPPETAIVLYQGLLMRDRGIEESMDAILDVPDAVLVLMGFGDQNGRGAIREGFQERAQRAPWLGRVHVVDPVAPTELLEWSASSDIMVMAYPNDSENHQQVTPQKLWEAMAAAVPVVASDLPGMAPIVSGVGFGVLCDPSSPASIAAGIRQLLDEGPAGLRARGRLGWEAAQETYNWAVQFEVLDSVYARLLAKH